jgi:hypothetical protein
MKKLINSEEIKSILIEISSIPTNLGESEFLKEICVITCNCLQLTFVGLYTLNLDKKMVLFRAGSGKVGRLLVERGHSLPADGNSGIAKSIRFNQVWLSKLTGDIFKCSLPTEGKMKNVSILKLQYETTETWLASPLIPVTWQISLPLRMNGQGFGVLSIFHEDDTFGVSIEKSTAYLQRLADEIAVVLDDLGMVQFRRTS